MACLRLTLIQPRPGYEQEARRLLKELDADLGPRKGLLMSLVFSDESRGIGRVSLWETRREADQNAGDQHVLAIRTRLRHIATTAEESLIEVESGHLRETLKSVFDTGRSAAYLPDLARQAPLALAR